MTTYVMVWPIDDPDMPITDLKAEARADLRAALAHAGLEPVRPVVLTVQHGQCPELRATVRVRPETWRRGLTTENLRALKTVTRCPSCDQWTCAEKWQRRPHQCAGVAAHVAQEEVMPPGCAALSASSWTDPDTASRPRSSSSSWACLTDGSPTCPDSPATTNSAPSGTASCPFNAKPPCGSYSHSSTRRRPREHSIPRR